MANISARLPQPVIVEADGTYLSLSALKSDATVTVAPWEAMQEGQRVWLTISRTDLTKWITLYQSAPVITKELTQGLRKIVSRGDLESLGPGGVAVLLEVSFFHPYAKSDAVTSSRFYRLEQ
jgi:hypothetical protein